VGVGQKCPLRSVRCGWTLSLSGALLAGLGLGRGCSVRAVVAGECLSSVPSRWGCGSDRG
jgi:hypothetical protein